MSEDAAIEDNLWSMWSQFGRGAGATLHEDRGALWFETPIPVPPYNMVIRFHGDDGADATIDAIFGRFRARGVPFVWFVHPTARPGDLRQRLEARGFAAVDTITGMAADLRELPPVPAPPDGVEVRELTPGQDVAVFLAFVAARWNVSGSARGRRSACMRNRRRFTLAPGNQRSVGTAVDRRGTGRRAGRVTRTPYT